MSAGRWIFGYGSLVWRPAFAHQERRTGYVEGWTRRFWQGSTDHRGVPGAPGRVVTLVAAAGERTWGCAYLVADAELEAVIATLDHREQGGYARHDVRVFVGDGSIDALVYVATPDNAEYLGPAPLGEIARQIVRSRGPSGPNDEYALELAAALRGLGADDPHVFEVADQVLGLRAARER